MTSDNAFEAPSASAGKVLDPEVECDYHYSDKKGIHYYKLTGSQLIYRYSKSAVISVLLLDKAAYRLKRQTFSRQYVIFGFALAAMMALQIVAAVYDGKNVLQSPFIAQWLMMAMGIGVALWQLTKARSWVISNEFGDKVAIPGRATDTTFNAFLDKAKAALGQA